MQDAPDLIAFLQASPSPFHAVAEAARRLDEVGFTSVREVDAWPAVATRHYTTRGASLVAWSGDTGAAAAGAGFRVIAAHTDSPNLRVKPRPDIASGGWRQVGIEVYGGALVNSWLDRDLGLSGRVAITEGHATTTRTFRDDRPLLRVPQLAVHLDRDVNTTGLKLNPQTQLVPVWAQGPPEPEGFRRYLAGQVEAEPDQVVAWDAMAHDISPPTLAGRDGEFMSSGRIDDLLSCWAAVRALGDVFAEQEPGAAPVAVVSLFDHEEVGSVSSTGAGGDLLATTLERLVSGAGGDRDAFLRAIAASTCVSADGAHATHPNYPERHDPTHPVVVNGGPVIKHNANVRYATDAPGAALFELACRRAGVPVQHFVSRGDMGCGSTIGPTTAARLGISTVDVGVAQLAMHSAREMCGSRDPTMFARALKCYLTDAG